MKPFKEISIDIYEKNSGSIKYTMVIKVDRLATCANYADVNIGIMFQEANDFISQYVHGDYSLYKQPVYRMLESTPSNILQVRSNKKKMRKTETTVAYVEVDNSPEENDIIWLEKIGQEKSYTIPMVKVISKKGVTGICGNGLYGFSNGFYPLSNIIQNDYLIVRTVRRKEHTDRFESFTSSSEDFEGFKFKRKTKAGSVSSLYESYLNVKAINDYFEERCMNGDVLLDEWMNEAYVSAQRTMKELETLINVLETVSPHK